MTKVLLESDNNKATLLQLTELEKKAETVFSDELVISDNIGMINASDILRHEKNSILLKRIIGKEDVDIAAMIKKLGNSDWVKQGLSYYKVNDRNCPFCQQITNHNFEESLNEYFDETFIQDNATVNKLVGDYATDAMRLQQQVESLINSQSEFLNIEKLKSEKQILDSIIAINKQRLNQKQKETSQVVSLDTLENVLSKITSLINEANQSIDERNRICENLQNEKATLTSQIWKFIVAELSSDIAEYNRKKNGLDKAISNIMAQYNEKKENKLKKEKELSELEKQSTSIVPTRDGINKLLDSFGFKNFKLEIGDDGKSYKLIRENGTEAQQTLSEGEKNFVTFLYFYYLLKGSQTETGLLNNKVVVFDDPISSLDNDVLFIISTLIREVIQDTRDKVGDIKQVFILTHNIYFHKEVTYNRNRRKELLSEETFWLVKKNGNNSLVEMQIDNPIKTQYELLWDEVRNENRNKATIQNTLRRILENYFKLLGNMPLDKLYKEFDGENKVICKALCSWIHDGSHSAFGDDFYTPLDEVMIAKYLEVFRNVFVNAEQISHYNMMMGIKLAEETTEEENTNGQS